MKTYTGLYIFAATAKDDVLDAQVEKAANEITRLSGKVLETEIIGKKTFARPMHKRDCGVYVKLRFELDPANIAPLNARYRLMEEVFRVQFNVVDPRLEKRLAAQAEVRKAREAAKAAKAEAAAEEQPAASEEA